MAVQSPTRRLLTEAAAALLYRTAAQVDTAADARIAAQRGAVNGVAALGPDGLVPSAQLPVGSAALTAAKTTDTSRVNTVALTNDPQLILPGLTAGLYRIELALLNAAGGAPLLARLGNGAGDPAPAVTALGVGVTQLANGGAPTSWAYGTTIALGAANMLWASGVLRLSAGPLAVAWAQNTAGATPTVLQTGSFLRAERLGA